MSRSGVSLVVGRTHPRRDPDGAGSCALLLCVGLRFEPGARPQRRLHLPAAVTHSPSVQPTQPRPRRRQTRGESFLMPSSIDAVDSAWKSTFHRSSPQSRSLPPQLLQLVDGAMEVEVLMKRMVELQQQEEECTQEEMVTRFERERSESIPTGTDRG